MLLGEGLAADAQERADHNSLKVGATGCVTTCWRHLPGYSGCSAIPYSNSMLDVMSTHLPVPAAGANNQQLGSQHCSAAARAAGIHHWSISCTPADRHSTTCWLLSPSQNRMGRLYYSRVGLTMLAKHNSSHCLAKGNCKPLGGFSVWAALPPLDPAKNNTKPITLVVAQIDGIDMFHDEIVVRRWVCARRGVLIAPWLAQGAA